MATVEAGSYELAPPAIARVRRRVPGLRAGMRIGDTALVLGSIANGAAAVGIAINLPWTVPARSPGTMANRRGLVAPKAHRLARLFD